EGAGVQPLPGGTLPASGERPAGLHGSADAPPRRRRSGRRDRRRHCPANAGLCRLQRPERRLARARAVGRASSGADVRPHRPRRPDLSFGVQHRGFPRAADAAAGPRLPPRTRGTDLVRSLHLCLGAAVGPERASPRAHFAQHVRDRLSAASQSGRDHPDVGRNGPRQPGRSAERHRPQPRPPAGRVPEAWRGRRRDGLHRRALFRCRAAVAAGHLFRTSARAERTRGNRLRTDQRRLPWPRPGPAQPSRRPIGRDGLPLQRDRRISPDPRPYLRAFRARPICVEAAAQLRAVRGGQLHGRARLRSGRPARRHGIRNPGRDPHRKRGSGEREQGRAGGLHLLGSCDGPRPRQPRRRCRFPTPRFCRRRRAGEFQPLRARRRLRSPAHPDRLEQQAARPALPGLAYDQAVPVELLMMRNHKPAFRASRNRLLISCATVAIATAGLLPQKAQAQAVQGTIGSITGTVTRTNTTSTSETITIGSPTATINWTPTGQPNGNGNIDFLPAGNVATFQGTTNAGDFTVLNRIVPSGAFPIELNGTVQSFLANNAVGGNIWFYSPNGILIGATAVFNVGGLLLTTADPGNNWSTTAGGFTANMGPASSTSFVTVSNGAQINAQSSYVAIVAPKITQAGSVNVNGSVAYVAAEQATLTFNQGLFDIAVDVGTDDPNGIIHTGSTTGTGNATSADNHSIYMVAVPKNQALTMLLGGTVGFSDVQGATVQNGQIILSAGYNVTSGIGAVPVDGLQLGGAFPS